MSDSSRRLKIGIVGAGLIGGKRAAVLPSANAELVAVADTSIDRAEVLAKKYGSRAFADWRDLVALPNVDAVVVATSNDAIVDCAIAALRSGKHVLAEKPAGRNPSELRKLVEAASSAQTVLKIGFNHRFHPAFQKAKALIFEGAIGPLLYFRARYGHGGRVGYDREWRADPTVSGGGELLDQGVHLIDLVRWLGGEFELEHGRVQTFFWNMPVEDNGFLLLKAKTGPQYAWLHASCTEWKNLFDFEIFGRDGKLQIWGLGRSYGQEELRYYRMKPEMGPPDIEVVKFPEEDTSWALEFDAFRMEMGGKPTDLGNSQDALRALEIVYEAYRQSGVSWAVTANNAGTK